MKKILFILSLALAAIQMQAKPAFPGPIPVMLENGEEDTVYVHGDEWLHWMTDRQGRWVEFDGKQLKQVKPMPTESIVRQRALYTSAAQAELKRNIAPRGLVILVEFPDLLFQPENTRDEFDSLLNADSYHHNNGFVSAKGNTYYFPAYGSARQYFHDQSMGQYNPQFDVIGPIMADTSYTYYGKNSGYSKDINIGKLIRECVQKADPVVDFSQYDNDNDGYVDFVYVFYAGNSESDVPTNSNYIWPKKWQLSANGGTIVLDGKTINMYACGSELNHWNTRDGIGTFCHEFGHVLGLQDMYTTTAKDTLTGTGIHKTLGTWDVMDYGPYNDNGNRPPSYSAYERWFCGWLTPTLLNETKIDTLQYIGTSNEAYILTGTDNMPDNVLNPDPTNFYLLENRQYIGWDSLGLHNYHQNYASVVYIGGHGMMVQKINFNYAKWNGNIVNNDSTNQGVSIVSADGWRPTLVHYYRNKGKDMSYLGKQGDLFPTEEIDYFQPYGTDYAISEIEETDNGEIVFQFTHGGQTTLLETQSVTTDNISGIYTPTGMYMGTDISALLEGLYILQTPEGVKKQYLK